MRVLYIVFLSVLLLCSCRSNVAEFEHQGLHYSISFHSEDIVHLTVCPDGTEAGLHPSLVVEEYTPYACSVKENEQCIVAQTAALRVEFDKSSGCIYFYDKNGQFLLCDSGRSFSEVNVAGEDTHSLFQSFRSSGDEALYGLGQYQDACLNYRGRSARLVQSNMDIVNPFLVTTGGYGILWDNYSATDFHDDGISFSFASEVADRADYYVLAGENMDALVGAYRRLTGKVPMFPRSVFGFWQSKERYRSFDELSEVVAEFRRREIPLDNIVQDWEYWGDKPHWNSMRFDAPGFSDAGERIRALHEEGNVNFMLSVWPGFGPETEICHELDSAGALFDEPTWAGYKVYDAFNPAARDIFWKHLKGLADMGVDAWWLDATEPSFRDGFTQDGQEARSKSAGMTHIGSFNRYLNAYSLEMMKELYPRLREHNPDRRVFIFTRSAFASQQRYATALWSGDVSASWEIFHNQLLEGLNISVSGIPYWTSDTGGFYVYGRDGEYPDGLADEEYKELYSRWFQFGAFTPIFRAHGTEIPREPWQFGDEGDVWYDNQLKYIRLRYRLLPYIYSVSRMVTENDYTFMRPLAMDFPADSRALDVDYAYMFGPAFYVRPVFRPAAEESVVETYLPECQGTLWYEFETSKPCRAGTVHSVPNRIDVLPLYVRAGSIVPMAEVKQWAGEYPDTKLDIAVYAGADGEFVWYDDEGDSYRYEQGLCSEVRMSWDDSARRLTFSGRQGSWPGMPESVQMRVTLHLPSGETVCRTIDYNNKEITLGL